MRKTRINGIPVRILTIETLGRNDISFVQVIQDRTAEQRTLDTLLAVLLGGGAIASGWRSRSGSSTATTAGSPSGLARRVAQSSA